MAGKGPVTGQGFPIFSVNFTKAKNSSLSKFSSIKKSQAMLKCFIDLKSSVWFTLGSEIETMFCELFWLPLSSFPFPDLSRKNRSDSASRVDCRSFSVTILTGSRHAEKSSKCHN